MQTHAEEAAPLAEQHIVLNHLIRETIANHPTDTAQQIAQLVCELTAPEDLARFYTQALESLVADAIRSHRNSTLNSHSGRSVKLEQRRAWWQRVLQERVHVGNADYKPIGDCTADEIEFCIIERIQQVSRLNEQIRKFEKIRAAMLEHGAATVANLPEGSVQL